MLDSILTVVLAAALGAMLAHETKKVTSEEQRKRIEKILNIFIVGMVLIVFIMIRPELPKEGFWQAFHSKEELAKYNEIQESVEQLKLIQKEIQQLYR